MAAVVVVGVVIVAVVLVCLARRWWRMLFVVAVARVSVLRVVLDAVENEDNEKRTEGVERGSTCLCHLEITLAAHMTHSGTVDGFGLVIETNETQFKMFRAQLYKLVGPWLKLLNLTWNLFGSRTCRQSENCWTTEKKNIEGSGATVQAQFKTCCGPSQKC